MNRSGWVEDRKGRNGKRWRARVMGADGRIRSKSFDRRIDADQHLTRELAKLDSGTWTDPTAGRVTVASWSESWLAGLHSLKPKTVEGYESLLRSRILPVFGPVQLRHVAPSAVRSWQTGMLDDGLSPARVKAARQVLGAMLRQAVDDGLIPSNPVTRVKAPKVRARRQAFLDARQVEALARACEERREGAGAFVYFLAWSGLRWGEAVALRWSAVDVTRRRVRVKVSVTEVSGRLEWGTPKSHETRTVIVPRFVVDRLGPKGAPDDLVFTAPLGGVIRNSNFRRAVWDRAVPAVEGLPADLVPHDLRDTAASLMISSGASIKAVQRALGHASAAMTLDVYGGLFDEDLEALADRMEERFADAGAPPARPQASNLVHFPR